MEAVPQGTSRATVTRLPGNEVEADRLAVEEPLEIRVNGTAVAVTMRTPGHDEELALGFCLTEGLRPLSARPPDDLAANVVEAEAPDADLGRIQRSFYTSSSCGVCGKGALEAVRLEAFGALALRIVDASGNGVSGVSFRLVPKDPPPGAGGFVASFRTRDDGTFVVPRLPPMRYTLRVAAPGGAVEQEVEVRPGVETPFEVRLRS